ncbi:MAG TPA: hypothetical protein VFD65_03710 [Chitinophagales bacterium]|nr:hypothetical protein [Chitinophagales bacterium]
MMSLNEKWDQILAKVRMLADKVRKKDVEINQLKSIVLKNEQEKKDWLKEKKELKETINVLKLAKGVGLSNQERENVKKQIEHYINEIDDCLAKINA